MFLKSKIVKDQNNLLFKIPRVEPVELVFKTGQALVYFPNLSVFDNGILVGMSAYKVGELPLTPDAVTVIPDVMLNKMFVTLFGKDNTVILQNVPLIDLVREDVKPFYTTQKMAINWQKSFIRIASPAAIVNNTAAFLNLYYFDAARDYANSVEAYADTMGVN